MLDVLEEFKKYSKINLDGLYISEPGGKAIGSILNRIADDMNRISKNQFKLGEQVEGFSEEILDILHDELNISGKYKSWESNQNLLINKLNCKYEEDKKRVESLVNALIRFSDAINMIHLIISNSRDAYWISEMERIKNSLITVMIENNLHETGSEKYFEDALHEIVAVEEDSNRDFREIILVVRNGYSYMGNTIRKAKVVVNNFRKENDKNE